MFSFLFVNLNSITLVGVSQAVVLTLSELSGIDYTMTAAITAVYVLVVLTDALEVER